MARPDAIARIIDQQWFFIAQSCNTYQLRLLDAIRRCRTPALGGHLYQCDECGQLHHRYHSCRNRHCCRCQHTQKEQWIEARQEQLLPCTYYHLVFTLPHQLNELCLVYPRQLYALLMRTAWQTIDAFGWNHKYLGAQIGATTVLHTWGSNLSFHPHVHCIVPAGGVSLSGKWKVAKGKGKFLFPVKALSQVFRAKFVDQLTELFDQQGLDDTAELVRQLYAKDWVVYAKPPFGGTKGLVRYLARYTHNIAISHHRIVSYDQQQVTLRYKDYRHGNVNKVMSLPATEFVRRLSLHLLPKGFCRIRHFGILAAAWKQKIFPNAGPKPTTSWEDFWKNKGLDVQQCPHCKNGTLRYLRPVAPARGPPPKIASPQTSSVLP